MTTTLGVVANIYNEIHALPGWLEMAASFADHIAVYHAGPGGAFSDDGTIELLERWGIPVTYGSMDDGFGAVRTAAIRASPCDWVMLLDADERFYKTLPALSCSGNTIAPPVEQQVLQEYDGRVEGVCPWNWENIGHLVPGVKVTKTNGMIDQESIIRQAIERHNVDCIAFIRRQWLGLGWDKPSQNWYNQPDTQARIVRNTPEVYWTGVVHESLKVSDGAIILPPDTEMGPFVEHRHLYFKSLAPEQRMHDIHTYRRIWTQKK